MGLVHADTTKAKLIPDYHLTQIADLDRSIVSDCKHGVPYVVESLDQTKPADNEHLRAVFNVGPACILVTILQSLNDLLKSEVIALELYRIDQHLVLLGWSAEAID